ncbi:MAG: hypothetical protein A3I75_07875 [Deltaproteobacteria bacterium RIFCSPLOWO2_02_FULL_50_16]|nr:MAG: hypothetical protein A3I75_07875 [Deltaproteobacteria bacterium RIFCSPLOWO2_02_FULL_50_16]OGQ67883.1 MAG: hypothetical protein A3F89_06925 [Deltaproteobacteria bacterium RIFCSPLOWO2_12_FULL_50_11]
MMNIRLKTEIKRKLIHILGLVFVPLLYYSQEVALILCGGLIPIYWIEEYLFRQEFKLKGMIPFFQQCKRPYEKDVFVFDPIYMVVGVFFAMLFYPVPAAACAIFQVSLADAGAAIMGVACGRTKIPWNPRKSWQGSGAFFIIAFLVSLLFFDWNNSLLLALVGTLLEQTPFKGIDNLVVPLGVGGVGMLLMG